MKNHIDLFELRDRVKFDDGGLFPTTGIITKVCPKTVLVECEDTGVVERVRKEKLSWCSYQPG